MRDALYQDAAGACPRRGPVCFEDGAQSCFAVTALRPRLRARRARAVSKDRSQESDQPLNLGGYVTGLAGGR